MIARAQRKGGRGKCRRLLASCPRAQLTDWLLSYLYMLLVLEPLSLLKMHRLYQLMNQI